MRLSKKNGLNPTMIVCQYCGEPKYIAFAGAAGDRVAKKMGRDDGKMPMRIAVPGDLDPCDTCAKKFKEKEAITIFEVAERTVDGSKYPTLTGRACDLPVDALHPDTPGRDRILEKHMVFMTVDQFTQLCEKD